MWTLTGADISDRLAVPIVEEHDPFTCSQMMLTNLWTLGSLKKNYNQLTSGLIFFLFDHGRQHLENIGEVQSLKTGIGGKCAEEGLIRGSHLLFKKVQFVTKKGGAAKRP